ncbi:MAG: hypothetical protein RIS47_2333 [Bacteroidota bacterium]|jgi:protein-tyrosine phosphatase
MTIEEQDSKINILFVCLGNICRSPAAQGVMQHLVNTKNLGDKYFIDSAGTAAYHSGERADYRMRQYAHRRNYNLPSIARQVTVADLDKFDIILAMDDNNFEDLLEISTSDAQRAKIRRMIDFVSGDRHDSVPDPYYGGHQGFEVVLDILEEATQGLLDFLENANPK